MAKTREELNSTISNVQTAEVNLVSAVSQYMAAVNDMLNRFLAKIAEGNDYQAEVDKLAPISQELAEKLALIQSAIAQVSVEGQ